MVLGSRHDQAASDIVKRWAQYDAALLSCEDISTPGWRYRPFDRAASRAVVSGRVIPEGEIRGVLVRRPWIAEQELAHIRASDREYVAAEMNAFLRSWLGSLRCTVLNRPSGTSLCGPNWRPVQWAEAAARAGIEVETTSWRVPGWGGRRARAARGGEPCEVTLVGNRCLGSRDDDCAEAARRLAAAAKVGLLAVRFVSRGSGRGPSFVAASAMPNLSEPDVARAVLDHLLSGPTTDERA